MDKYCSPKFKTGEELDNALTAALSCCDEATRAELAAVNAGTAANAAANSASVVSQLETSARKAAQDAQASAEAAAASAEAAANGSGSSGGTWLNPDLSQNDETQPDYVKGRTHWLDQELEECVVLKVTLNFSVITPHPTFHSLTYEEAGRNYRVTWDGVEYECASKNGNNGDVYLGDYSLVDGNAAASPEYPFCCVFPSGSKTATAYNAAYTGTAVKATLTIWRDGELIYHKLDEGFLPESVGCIVLRSSTEGSSKLYKLTIDDSGTISVAVV